MDAAHLLLPGPSDISAPSDLGDIHTLEEEEVKVMAAEKLGRRWWEDGGGGKQIWGYPNMDGLFHGTS